MEYQKSVLSFQTDRGWRYAWCVLTLLVAFVSSGWVQKAAGLGGVLAYALAVGIALWAASQLGTRWERGLQRRLRGLLGGFVVLLAGGFVVLHPLEDGKGPGKSSDRDEALEIAVKRMAQGHTPYYPSNPEAGPLSVLPGGVMLAAPFVAIGKVGLQNVFWLLVFILVCAQWHGSSVPALVLCAALFATSPSTLYEWISGGDMIANGAYVAVALGLCASDWMKGKTSARWKWGACLLLGIALASRPNFILLLPLLGAVVWRAAGLREAVICVGAAGMAALAIILPFYLNDPAGFTPLVARKKLAMVDHVLPWAGLFLLGLTIAAAVIASGFLLRREKPGVQGLMQACCWVTLCPMLGAVALQSWVSGSLNFDFMRDRFGLMYAFFAVAGWGGQWLLGREREENIAPARPS